MGKYSTLNKTAVHQDTAVQKKKSTQNVPGFEDNRPEAVQLAKFNEADIASGSLTVQRVTVREHEKRGGKV